MCKNYSKYITFIPKACILEATSLPIRPSPIIANVLSSNSFAIKFFLSHFPLFSVAHAKGICLKSNISIN